MDQPDIEQGVPELEEPPNADHEDDEPGDEEGDDAGLDN